MKRLEDHNKEFLRGREFSDEYWEKLYLQEEVETMPWFHPVLDLDLDQALHKFKIYSGDALDLGSGPGTQAIALAERGFNVTATDVSPSAIRKARERAEKEHGMDSDIEFLHDDILNTGLKKQFDIIFDRGCFHVIPPAKRKVYVKIVERLLKPGGYLFLKCFSHLETMEGPYRFSPEELRGLFSPAFNIHSIDETKFYGPLETFPRALFSTMQKPM